MLTWNVWEICVCVCVCVCVCDRESVLLWWFSRQVGDQRGDGTDVRDDPKHNGEHREPQSLARRCVRPLKIPLSRRLVGLEERGEQDKDFFKKKEKRGEKGIRHHLSTSSSASTFLFHSFESQAEPIVCSISESQPPFVPHSSLSPPSLPSSPCLWLWPLF